MESTVTISDELLGQRDAYALHARPSASLRSTLDDTDVAGAPEAPARPTRTYQTLLLAAGFLMVFHVIGINSIYGLFQDVIKLPQEFYTSPDSNIKAAQGQDALVSLVGTIGRGLTWSGSIFVNPLMAKFDNLMIITLVGAFVMSMGLFLASFSTELWHLYLTQALLYGIGSSLYYFPIMSLTPAYFNRRRGAAMGIVLAGSGVGGLILSPVVHALLNSVGIRWALRVLAVWNFILGIPVALVLNRKHTSGNRIMGSNRVSMALVKRGTFILQSLGAFLQAAGNMVPTYFLTTYSVSVLGYSSGTGSLLLAVNTAVNSLARVGMGVLADYAGRQNTMVLSVILSGVSVLALWLNADRARFLTFIVFYGILAGGYNALLPTTITEVYGVQNYSSVNSFIYFIRGLGALFGAPVAGAILGHHKRGTIASTKGMFSGVVSTKMQYNEVAIFDGALLLASGICVAYVRWLDARDKGRWAWRA
ncbi:hypothetical protein CERSUDRAFT_161575, partial [Gelatoporia subvermispora B]